MSREMRCASSPFGLHPDELRLDGHLDAARHRVGCFPIRLIDRSPHVGDDFAAHSSVTRLVPRHHALGVEMIEVPMPPNTFGTWPAGRTRAGRAATRAEARDHGRAVLGVLQPHPQVSPTLAA